MRYHVFIILKGQTEYDFICTTSGDIGEIVTACQVLYPDMDSIAIEGVGEEDAAKVS